MQQKVPQKSFELDTLLQQLKGDPIEYLQFLKVPKLSCGVYQIAKGELDPQQPHDEDEIYLVLGGVADFEDANGKQRIKTGTILYVAAGDGHKFVDIQEDLSLLVFFAAN